MRGHLLFSCGPPSSIPAQSLDRNVFSPPCGVSSACPEDRVRASVWPATGRLQQSLYKVFHFGFRILKEKSALYLLALGRTWKSTLLITGDDQCLHRRPSRARFSSAVLSQLSDPSSDDRGRNRSNWHYWSRAHISGTVAERFTQAGHGVPSDRSRGAFFGAHVESLQHDPLGTLQGSGRPHEAS